MALPGRAIYAQTDDSIAFIILLAAGSGNSLWIVVLSLVGLNTGPRGWFKWHVDLDTSTEHVLGSVLLWASPQVGANPIVNAINSFGGNSVVGCPSWKQQVRVEIES